MSADNVSVSSTANNNSSTSTSTSTNTSTSTRLDAEQLEELREAFNLFDKDGDGTITANELGKAMEILGQHPTAEELEILINSVDKDDNGVIDFDEFADLMKGHLFTSEDSYNPAPQEDEELLEAFKMFDRNGDGFISPEELKTAFINLGERMSDREIEEMIHAADKNMDGLIDYKEFIEMMKM